MPKTYYKRICIDMAVEADDLSEASREFGKLQNTIYRTLPVGATRGPRLRITTTLLNS